MKSRAVPNGLPEKPGDRRLAIAVEDHPLDYIGFQGTIPEGQYGAGEVKINDSGTCEILTWRDDWIEVLLFGQIFSGKYVLIRFKKRQATRNGWCSGNLAKYRKSPFPARMVMQDGFFSCECCTSRVICPFF